MTEPVQIVILGQTFSLRSAASVEEVQRVAAFVNQQLAEAAKGRSGDSLHAALLTLLNVAGSYLQLRDGNSGVQHELEGRLGRLLQHIEEECPALPSGSRGAGGEPVQSSLCLET